MLLDGCYSGIHSNKRPATVGNAPIDRPRFPSHHLVFGTTSQLVGDAGGPHSVMMAPYARPSTNEPFSSTFGKIEDVKTTNQFSNEYEASYFS